MHVSFIGRKDEINTINEAIGKTGEACIICIGGTGGIGKSRLLRKIFEQEPSFQGASIVSIMVDFDDLTFSNPENVLHRISQISQKAFNEYSQFEKELQNIRISDVTADVVKHREEINNVFVRCFNGLSAEKRIVLYFDTTDKLHPEHGVEKKLLSILPRLNNMVSLMAGRNAEHLYQSFSDGKPDQKNVRFMPLQPFSTGESLQYLREKANIRHVTIEDELAEKLIHLSEGKPILIDLAVDWRAGGILLDWLRNADILKFKQELVSRVRKLEDPMNRLVLMMAHVYPLNIELLEKLFDSETDVKVLFDEAKRLSFVKLLPNRDISLHDVMRDMVNCYVWPQIPTHEDRRRWYSEKSLQYFENKISELEPKIKALKEEIYHLSLNGIENTGLHTETEVKRQQLWVLKEQLLKHTLIVDLAKGVEFFAKIYMDASKDSRVTLIPQFIQLVEENRGELSDGQTAVLDYHSADYLFFQQNEFDAAKSITEDLLHKNFLPIDLKIKCINLKANIRIRQGDVNGAIEDFTHSVELSDKHKETALSMISTNALGWAYRTRYDMEQAMAKYQKARQIYHQADDETRRFLENDYGLLLNNLAFLLSLSNRTCKDGIGMAKMAVDHWKRIGNEIGEGKGYLALGTCYMQSDLAILSLNAFQKALDIFEPLKLKAWSASIHAWRGALYHNIDENEKAEKDLEYSRVNGPKHILPMTLNKLGRIHMKRKEWKRAEEFFTKSLRSARSVPDYKYWLSSLARLMHIAAQNGQSHRLENFKYQYDECLRAIKAPDNNSKGIACFGLARLAFLQNSPEEIPFITDQLKEGIPLIVEHGSWARTDIMTWVKTIEGDLDKVEPHIIQQIGEKIVYFLSQKEKEDFSYSTALEPMYRWKRWNVANHKAH